MGKNNPNPVTINRDSVIGLALRGPQSRCAQLYPLVEEALKRLKVKADGAKELSGGVDNYPMVHDVQRWLEDLTPQRKREVNFLRRLAVTLARRM